MDYPLYTGGMQHGVLRVLPDGLMTLFDAECEDTGELIRLYIFGDGKRYCLGTMTPANGKLHLTKRLSRSEMQKLPESIIYAADSELEKEEDDALLWIQSRSGILYGFDGEKSLTALPWSSWRKPHGARLIQINGRDYIVFSGKRTVVFQT